MARRTIFLPDDLEERVDQLKDRLNVSGVCQEALRREVARLNFVPGEIEIPEEVVIRLRQEKAEWEEKWWQAGYELAIQTVPRFNYPWLREWVGMAERQKREGQRFSLGSVEHPLYSVLEHLFDYTLDAIPEARYIISWSKTQESAPALKYFACWDPLTDEPDVQLHDVTSLKLGFLEGIRVFWGKVKEMI